MKNGRSCDFGDGYGEYFCGDTWRLSITQKDSIELSKQVRFKRLTSFADRECRYNIKTKRNVITKITEQESLEENVYCCTVDTNNQVGIGVGVITGQCVEASVNLNFCNLTTFNMAEVNSNSDLKDFAKAASFIGTLQAGYTDFHYLRPIWQERTEKEALLGVSMTGLSRLDLDSFDLVGAAEEVLRTNEHYANVIGINKANRATVNKPEGTSSAVLGTSSGVHAWHAKYICRRVRYQFDDPMLMYLESKMPELIEQDKQHKNMKIFTYPIAAREGSAIRGEESSIDLLERVLHMSTSWVKPGHRKGNNGHSVSATIEVKDGEWEDVAEWMWKNRNNYNGLAVFPYDNSSHEQTPFEAITKEKFEDMNNKIVDIDLKEVKEYSDNTTRQQEAACAGGVCEI
jgi:ribonucleoside-diphosphate reductase alpha chain